MCVTWSVWHGHPDGVGRPQLFNVFARCITLVSVGDILCLGWMVRPVDPKTKIVVMLRAVGVAHTCCKCSVSLRPGSATCRVSSISHIRDQCILKPLDPRINLVDTCVAFSRSADQLYSWRGEELRTEKGHVLSICQVLQGWRLQ